MARRASVAKWWIGTDEVGRFPASKGEWYDPEDEKAERRALEALERRVADMVRAEEVEEVEDVGDLWRELERFFPPWATVLGGTTPRTPEELAEKLMQDLQVRWALIQRLPKERMQAVAGTEENGLYRWVEDLVSQLLP